MVVREVVHLLITDHSVYEQACHSLEACGIGLALPHCVGNVGSVGIVTLLGRCYGLGFNCGRICGLGFHIGLGFHCGRIYGIVVILFKDILNIDQTSAVVINHLSYGGNESHSAVQTLRDSAFR